MRNGQNRDELRYLRNLPSVAVWKLALVVGLAIVSAVAQGASIGLLIPAMQLFEDPDSLSQSGALGRAVGLLFSMLRVPFSPLAVGVGVLGLVVFGQVLHYTHRVLAIRNAEGLGADLRRAAFESFLRAEMGFHYRSGPGVLTASVIEEANRAGTAYQSLQEMLGRSVLVLLYASLLVLISWQVSVIAIGIVVLSLVGAQFLVRISRRIGRNISQLNTQMQAFTMERIQGVREIKLSVRGDVESRLFDGLVESMKRERTRLAERAAQMRPLLEPAMVGAGLLIVYLGFTFFGMSWAELGVFMYALIRISPEGQGLNQARFTYAGHVNSVSALVRMTWTAAEQSEEPREGGQPFDGLREGLTLENVTFAYEGKPPALADISLSIVAGRTTAIVGPSGAGKSTLLGLVARLLAPTSGRVLLDGLPVQEFDLSSLRRGIGIVTQEPLLFNDTVRENIRFSDPHVPMEVVESVARLANAEEFIQKLPQGYDTVVGDRGVGLSVGQRQRLALARALLRNPPLLLLDEVTSSVDPTSERLLHEAVWQASGSRTVLIVSHRLSSIQGVDRVLVLADGRVVEDGPPEELLKHDGLFRSYYDFQIGGGWTQESSAERLAPAGQTEPRE